jgi:hypothetical protein
MMNREKAIEDEIFIDITDLAKQVYFKYPVAITAGLFLKLGNNMGLVWDALNLLYFKIKRERIDQNVFYEVKLGNIIAICSPGDNEEPVITIMMSNEARYFKEERGRRLAPTATSLKWERYL